MKQTGLLTGKGTLLAMTWLGRHTLGENPLWIVKPKVIHLCLIFTKSLKTPFLIDLLNTIISSQVKHVFPLFIYELSQHSIPITCLLNKMANSFDRSAFNELHVKIRSYKGHFKVYDAQPEPSSKRNLPIFVIHDHVSLRNLIYQ